MEIEEIDGRHKALFLDFIREFEEADPDTFARLLTRENPWDEDEFHEYMKQCAQERLDWRPGPNRVSRTRYILRAPDGRMAAIGLLKFPLDEQSEISSGNLLVAVRPSLRGQGYGAYTLSRLLFEAVRAGLRRALVTCRSEDAAARRMIEKNRGQFFDEVETPEGTQCRFWIDFR